MSKNQDFTDKVNEALYRALNLVHGRVIYPAQMNVVKIEDAGDWKVVSVEAEATSVFELSNLDLFRSYFKENLDDLGIELGSAKVALVKKGVGLSLVVR
jgi:hypothetical protein